MESSSIRRLWQVAIALIVVQAVFGYFFAKLYVDKQMLSEQVATLNTQVSGLNSDLATVRDRVTGVDQKLVAVDQKFASLPQPPNADAVAKIIVADVKTAVAENITDAVAQTLAETPELSDRLKGEKGDPGPTVDEVAQKVYDTYHNELRGKDGANGVSPDAAQVAKVVAGDLQFADLVAQMKNQ
jgi:hypothetical protein